MPELQKGQCVRISTGAPVPPGADAVVQVEDTKLLNSSEDASKEIEIDILVAPTEGQDIRPIGCDIEAHSVILKKGIVLNAAEIGILAAVGKMKTEVYRHPVVGVISTGNEIQNPDLPLEYGKIRDSNKITLLSLLKQYGYEAQDIGLVKDEPNEVKRTFESAFSKCDIVITSGGVSMGEYDVIKRVLEIDFKAKVHFGRVNMKPGKPTTFATCLYGGKIKTVFGLPGNPVSATVTCLLFVIPALRHCENRSDIFYPKVEVQLDFEPILDAERPEYQRVRLKFGESRILAQTTGNQISSRLNSFVGADGLLILPPKKEVLDLSNSTENNTETQTLNIPTPSPSSVTKIKQPKNVFGTPSFNLDFFESLQKIPPNSSCVCSQSTLNSTNNSTSSISKKPSPCDKDKIENMSLPKPSTTKKVFKFGSGCTERYWCYLLHKD